GRIPYLLRGPPDEIGPIGRAVRIGTFDAKSTPSSTEYQGVVDGDRLKDGADLMIPVRPRSEDAQGQVNLCKRLDVNASRHALPGHSAFEDGRLRGPDRLNSSMVIGAAVGGTRRLNASASIGPLTSTCDNMRRKS